MPVAGPRPRPAALPAPRRSSAGADAEPHADVARAATGGDGETATSEASICGSFPIWPGRFPVRALPHRALASRVTGAAPVACVTITNLVCVWKMTCDPFAGGRQDLRPRHPPPRPSRRSPAPPGVRLPSAEPPSRPPLAVPLAPTAPRPASGSASVPGPRRADDRRVTAVVRRDRRGLPRGRRARGRGLGAGCRVLSPWLPLHLALAGGASTAIAGVMPFFVAALAAGHRPPCTSAGGGGRVRRRRRGAGRGAGRRPARSAGCPWSAAGSTSPGSARSALAVRASGRSGPDGPSADRDARVHAGARQRRDRRASSGPWRSRAGCRSSSAGPSSGPRTRGRTSSGSCRS